MPQRPTAARLGMLLVISALVLSVVPSATVAHGGPLIDGIREVPAPAPRVTVHVMHLPVVVSRRSPGRRTVEPAGSPSPCRDRARRFIGGRWMEAYRWSYRARTTPSGLTRKATIRTLKRAATNITSARNDCGRADRVSAQAIYLGTSDRKPGPTRKGTCAPNDGYNTVGFGRLPSGIAGLTCVWSQGDRIVEADIKFDRGARWATSLARCSFAAMLEAVATHEFGHAFGLGHVSESRHGRLTMSERLDGYCQNSESTLGLGDLRGLEELY